MACRQQLGGSLTNPYLRDIRERPATRIEVQCELSCPATVTGQGGRLFQLLPPPPLLLPLLNGCCYLVSQVCAWFAITWQLTAAVLVLQTAVPAFETCVD